MRARRAGGRPKPPNYTLLGILGALVVAACVYLVFVRTLPFSDTYEIQAVVRTANQLRAGSPVRVAGVDVGEVRRLSEGPGATTVVHMELTEHQDTVRKDARLRIRPRLFLEGGFYVDLQPGSPTAPPLGRDGVIPLGRTAGPVQLNDVLDVLDAPGRENLRNVVTRFSGVLDHGGAEGVRDALRPLRVSLRPLTQTMQATLGTGRHDLSRLVGGLSTTLDTLGAEETRLEGFVDGLQRTAGILAAEDGELGATIASTDRLLRNAPSALRAADRALPPTTRLARALRPALAGAPSALRDTDALLREVQGATRPEELPRLLRRLAPALRLLPSTARRMIPLFELVDPVSRCITERVTPVLRTKLDDGGLTTGLPVFKELQQAGVGLAGSSASFDANGSFVRYITGAGSDTVNIETLPGGQFLAGASPSKLRLRPQPLAQGTKPASRPDATCVEQPAPQLQTDDVPIHTFDDAKTTSAHITARDFEAVLGRLEDQVAARRAR